MRRVSKRRGEQRPSQVRQRVAKSAFPTRDDSFAMAYKLVIEQVPFAGGRMRDALEDAAYALLLSDLADAADIELMLEPWMSAMALDTPAATACAAPSAPAPTAPPVRSPASWSWSSHP